GLAVLKIVLMPSRHRLASLANSGPRWSMIGVSIARSTRSGSGVGPGMCRKWRATGREGFFDIRGGPSGAVLWASTDGGPARAAACRHQGRMRESVKPLATQELIFRPAEVEWNGPNGRTGARAAAQGASPGRGAVRRVHARALCHRRLALPDHAARRS